MAYRKFRADHLFTGYTWLDSDQVLIANEKGEIQDIVPAAGAGDDIQTFSGILCPGFVNAHCHLELSHLRGMIPENTGMVDFLVAVVSRRQIAMETVLNAMAAAESEMLENGIVAVGDICNTPHTMAQKNRQQLYYHSFIEAIGFLDHTAPQRFEQSRQLWKAFHHTLGNAVSIVPHAPYSVSVPLFQQIAAFPPNRILSLHNQESLAEQDFMVQGKGDMRRLYQALKLDISHYQPPGKNSLQACVPYFRADQTLLLVHNCTTNEADLQYLNNGQKDNHRFGNIIFCLCPNANLYIGNPLPDIELLRRYGATISIGTDSLASNHVLSILAELRTIRKHFPAIKTRELLQWATLNGARALGIEKQYGHFTPGAKPGVLVVDVALDSVKRII